MRKAHGRWWIGVLGAALASTAHAAPGDWLDRQPLPSWNRPGAKPPRAPRFDPDPFLERQCGAEDRQAASDADRTLVKRGWHLVGPARKLGDVEVILARSGSDGMCRPLGYQGFVFVEGRFAGTIAPRNMDARSDGSAWLPELAAGKDLTVDFARYASRDPLCCPSRTSTVRYRIDRTAKGPVVVATGVATVKNEDASPPATAPQGANPDAGTPAAAATAAGAASAPSSAAPATATAPAPASPAAPAPASASGLVNRSWELVRIRAADGTVLTPGAPSRYTVTLGEDGRAMVQADCNRAMGGYRATGSALTFGPLASTRAACAPDSLSGPFLSNLQRVAAWKVTDGILLLTSHADDAVIEFRAVPAPPPGTESGGAPAR